MKAKHALILLVFGFCLDFVASLFKIMHRPGADNFFIAATVLKISGALLLLYKITNYRKIKEFLNS